MRRIVREDSFLMQEVKEIQDWLGTRASRFTRYRPRISLQKQIQFKAQRVSLCQPAVTEKFTGPPLVSVFRFTLDKFRKIFRDVWPRQMKSEQRGEGHWLKFEQRAFGEALKMISRLRKVRARARVCQDAFEI